MYGSRAGSGVQAGLATMQGTHASPLLKSTFTATFVSCQVARYTPPKEPRPIGSSIVRSLHCTSHIDVSGGRARAALPPSLLPPLALEAGWAAAAAPRGRRGREEMYELMYWSVGSL